MTDDVAASNFVFSDVKFVVSGLESSVDLDLVRYPNNMSSIYHFLLSEFNKVAH